jgi:hypothetical protein
LTQVERLRRAIPAVLISAAMSATFAAPGSASAFALCGSAQSGSLVSAHWAERGPVRVSISDRAAERIRRRIGPGVEGFHPTVADAKCSVALSVAVAAAFAWAKSPRRSLSVGVRIAGAGKHPYLGRFRCTVRRTGHNAAGTCTHRPDGHAGRIIDKFHIDRV